MKVNAKVKTPFYHGNKPFAEGGNGEFTKAEAHDLEKSGLIEIGSEVESEPVETKMAEAPENKMAEAPANKSRASKEK